MRKVICILLLVVMALPAMAQRYPERRQVRKGNRAYEKGRYEEAAGRYRRALEAAPESWEGRYNLASALYRTEQYDNAVEMLNLAAQDTLRTPIERSEAYYNLGNVHFSRQKLAESLDAFRSALRLNPDDEDAKFNFIYVKRLMQNQENEQNQDNQDNQDNQENREDQQNQDNQEEQQNQGNQDNQDNQKNPDQEEQNAENQPREPQDGEGEGDPQPAEGSLSEEEQERLLEAIQAQEDATQERLKEGRGVVVRGSKPW